MSKVSNEQRELIRSNVHLTDKELTQMICQKLGIEVKQKAVEKQRQRMGLKKMGGRKKLIEDVPQNVKIVTNCD